MSFIAQIINMKKRINFIGKIYFMTEKKYCFRNGNIVFCIIGYEISSEFILENLFYDHTFP
jgi:hypothetical protein